MHHKTRIEKLERFKDSKEGVFIVTSQEEAAKIRREYPQSAIIINDIPFDVPAYTSTFVDG